jgi:hypothetical protein
MRQVTGSMGNVVKGMDQAMKSMDLEKVSSLGEDEMCLRESGGTGGNGEDMSTLEGTMC